MWHGLNAPLLMSVFAFVARCLLFVALRRRCATVETAPLTNRVQRQADLRAHAGVVRGVAADLPQRIERLYPSRRLQSQLLWIVLLALLAGGLAAASAPLGIDLRWSSIDPAFALLWLLGAVCAVAGAATPAKFHRLAALILSGGAGLVSCVSFVWLSAPRQLGGDPALLVEVVATVLILLGMRWLPKRIAGIAHEGWRQRFRRRRDIVIALVVGAGVASLAYAAMMHLHPVADSISRFFLERAYTEGGGHDVVNVILVDFRGFDALGEISVLAIVALTVFALLRRLPPGGRKHPSAPAQQRQQTVLEASEAGRAADHSLTDYLMIPGLIIQLMAPVILLFGLRLLLRGHDLPGGGFVAGITVAVALILLYMARGARWVEAHLRVLPVR
ncbi:hydrogen gas-evolving membrane-bound hydrogenase subunit E [Rhodanobacter lindaniclasticus]